MRICKIKTEAREKLAGNWGKAAFATLVFGLVAVLTGAPSIVDSILTNPILGGTLSSFSTESILLNSSSLPLSLFIMYPLTFGLYVTFLEFSRGNVRKSLAGDIFYNGFKWRYWRGLGCMLLVSIFTLLWTLLFIIPGIIMSFAYAMTYYVAKDNPELSVIDCIRMSRAMMKGYKWKLFVLYLSFLGWALLCVLTAGIGFLWLVPYINTSTARFYETVKLERETGKDGF